MAKAELIKNKCVQHDAIAASHFRDKSLSNTHQNQEISIANISKTYESFGTHYT